MPVSDYHNYSDILHIVEQIKPRRILDIGIGFGIWGVLMRQLLEMYEGRWPKQWNITLEGLEIYEKFRNPLWDYAYDKVVIGDAYGLLDNMGHYDLILACDVIEHFEKSRGRKLLEEMIQHADFVILTTPISFNQPGDVQTWGDKYETHKSLWSRADFKDIPHIYKRIVTDYLVLLCSDKKRLRSINIIRPCFQLGVKGATLELLRLIFERASLRIKELFSGGYK